VIALADPHLPKVRDLLRKDVLAAAPCLLGMHLVHGGLRARIVEVEAYRADDPACHAFGKTRMKNMAMFGEAGFAYVYFNYGMHWMLNVTAHPPGEPAAILIRAAEPLDGMQAMWDRRPKARRAADLLSGPGKLAAALGIDAGQNGADLIDPRSELRLEPGSRVERVAAAPRIGIAHGKGHELPWRFLDRDSLAWASRPLPR
jgi:DNA-3-methyladenine glycosylase